MKTINCEQCKSSVMGLVNETLSWAVYKCFSCHSVVGRLNEELKPDEREEAEREMDDYAFSLTDAEAINKFKKMSSKEILDWFKANQK